MKKKIVRVEQLDNWNDGSKKGTIKKYNLKDALLWEKEGMVKILDDIEEKNKVVKKPSKMKMKTKEDSVPVTNFASNNTPVTNNYSQNKVKMNKKGKKNKIKKIPSFPVETVKNKNLKGKKSQIQEYSDMLQVIFVTNVTNVTDKKGAKVTKVTKVTRKVLCKDILGSGLLERVFSLLYKSPVISYDLLGKILDQNGDLIRATCGRKENKKYFKESHKEGKIKFFKLSDLGNLYVEQKINEYIEQKNNEKIGLLKKETERIKDEDKLIEFKSFYNFNKKIIGNSLRKFKNIIYVDFNDLIEFSPDLADSVLSKPERMLKLAEIAFEEMTTIKDIKFRIKNIPDSQRLNIEGIRQKNINDLIFIEGRIVRVSKVLPQCVSAKFECPSCGTVISVLQIEKKFREPSRCSCGRRGGFKLISKEMVDTARIVLEDLQEKTDNPHTQRISCYIKEDLTNEINMKMFAPGNEVKLIGILKEVPMQLNRGGLSVLFDIAVEVNNAELSEEEINIDSFSNEEIKKIKKLSSKINIKGLNEINSSFAPDIYGYKEIKDAIILQLCNKRNEHGKNKIRNKPNILLMGDPGVAKSVLGNFAVDITPGSRKVTGGGSSAVGITASVIKDEDGWGVEPGAFVLAKDLLFIDELNNINDDDKPKLQEALSEQSITINKANIRMTMKVTAGVLATANPFRGIFKLDEEMVKQFNLPPPIINRFDLIFTIKDYVDKNSDIAIAEKMIKRDRGIIKTKYSKEFLKKFFAYIKNFDEPIITNKITKRLEELYTQLRRYKTDTININPRINESIIRLIKASAKIRLSRKVEEKDIERAINILSKSYYNVPDYDTFKNE